MPCYSQTLRQQIEKLGPKLREHLLMLRLGEHPTHGVSRQAKLAADLALRFSDSSRHNNPSLRAPRKARWTVARFTPQLAVWRVFPHPPIVERWRRSLSTIIRATREAAFAVSQSQDGFCAENAGIPDYNSLTFCSLAEMEGTTTGLSEWSILAHRRGPPESFRSLSKDARALSDPSGPRPRKQRVSNVANYFGDVSTQALEAGQ
jgi:hypothetical protein